MEQNPNALYTTAVSGQPVSLLNALAAKKHEDGETATQINQLPQIFNISDKPSSAAKRGRSKTPATKDDKPYWPPDWPDDYDYWPDDYNEWDEWGEYGEEEEEEKDFGPDPIFHPHEFNASDPSTRATSLPPNMYSKANPTNFSKAARRKYHEGAKVTLRAVPHITQYKNWEKRMIRIVCNTSGRPEEVLSWAQTFKTAKTWQELAKVPNKNASINMKWASGLLEAVHGPLQRKIDQIEESENKNGRMLGGLQIAWIIRDWFKLDELEGGILDYEDLLHLRMHNQNLEGYIYKFESILAGLQREVDIELLENLLNKQLEFCQEFRATYDLYELGITQGGQKRSYERLMSMVRTHIKSKRKKQQRSDMHYRSQSVQPTMHGYAAQAGLCFSWAKWGNCPRGDNCPYRASHTQENANTRGKGKGKRKGKGKGKSKGKGKGKYKGKGKGKGKWKGKGKGKGKWKGKGKGKGKWKGKGKGYGKGKYKGKGRGRGSWKGKGRGSWKGRGRGSWKGRGKGKGYGKGKYNSYGKGKAKGKGKGKQYSGRFKGGHKGKGKWKGKGRGYSAQSMSQQVQDAWNNWQAPPRGSQERQQALEAKQNYRGKSPSGRTNVKVCQKYMKYECDNPQCDEFHPQDCPFVNQPSGCFLGNQLCKFRHPRNKKIKRIKRKGKGGRSWMFTPMTILSIITCIISTLFQQAETAAITVCNTFQQNSTSLHIEQTISPEPSEIPLPKSQYQQIRKTNHCDYDLNKHSLGNAIGINSTMNHKCFIAFSQIVDLISTEDEVESVDIDLWSQSQYGAECKPPEMQTKGKIYRVPGKYDLRAIRQRQKINLNQPIKKPSKSRKGTSTKISI